MILVKPILQSEILINIPAGRPQYQGRTTLVTSLRLWEIDYRRSRGWQKLFTAKHLQSEREFLMNNSDNEKLQILFWHKIINKLIFFIQKCSVKHTEMPCLSKVRRTVISNKYLECFKEDWFWMSSSRSEFHQIISHQLKEAQDRIFLH